MFLLVRAPRAGWSTPSALVSAVLAVALLTLFTVVETRSRDPLVPGRPFGRGGLVTAIAVTAVAF